MASADARINIVIQNERSLSRVIGKIEQVGGLLDTLNKKQLNIFGRTSGVGGDIAAKQLKNLQDNIRNVANASGDASAKARLLGNTFASVREKANAYDQVLQNVSLKNGGISRQNAEVKNLARAWAVAENQAGTYSKRLTKIQNDALRAEKGLQPQSVRDFEVARRKRLVADRRRRISAAAAASATQAAQIRARRQRFTDVATGFGFPLLFGGGVGQAVAGGLGGAALGLGGSIAASAVVSQVQALFDSFGELAAAMDQPVQLLEELADKGFDVGASTKSYVEALESQGRFAEAAAVANKELNKALGKGGIQAVKAYKDAQDDLQKAVTKLSLTIVTELGPAVTAFIGFVTDIIDSLPGAKAAELSRRSPESMKGVAVEAAERFGKKQSQNLFAGIFSDMFDFAGAGAAVEFAKELDRVSAETLESLGEQKTEQQEIKLSAKELLEIQRRRASLRANELPRIQQEEQFLKRELEIMRMTGPLQQMEKQTAEALLKADQARFNLLQARQELRKQERSPEFDGIKELELLKKIEEAAANSKRAEVEAEIAVEAERVFNFYTAQADALQGVVHQAKMRLNQEKAVLEGRNKLTGAYYSAELKINKLAIQRKKQQVELFGLDGDRFDLLQLEGKQVDLIYRQTIAQIKAEVERAQLKARQVELETKLLAVANLRKLAEDKLKDEDKQALQLQKQALQIANYNVKVAQQVADQQIRGAKATRAASMEALKFAYNQERAARAAGRAAKAMRGAGGGADDTWMVNGKEYTFQGSSSASRVGSGINIIQRSNPLASTAPSGLAEGGYVTRPTNALIAERGENEYVIPESKMNSAIKRYTRGARGESVVEGSGETSAAGRKRSGAVVNISTGPVMRMDDQDYVTVSDLNEAVGSVAVAMSSGSEVYGGSTRLS